MARSHPAQEHAAPKLNRLVELDAAELERRAAVAAELQAAARTFSPRGINAWQRDCIRTYFKRMPCGTLAEKLGITTGQLFHHARMMGLQGKA